MSPGFTAVARPGVVWLKCRERMRSRGTGQKRLMQPKKLSRACSSLQRTCGGQIRQNSRECALPNCRWLRAPGVPPSKALPPKPRHSSSQPTCGLELEALETPRPSQPRTVNPIIARLHPLSAFAVAQPAPSRSQLHPPRDAIISISNRRCSSALNPSR